MNPVRVYVDGIFDLFHPGHLKLFQKAIAKGQELFPGREVHLLVGVCDLKGYKREPIMNYAERVAAVIHAQIAQEVFEAFLTVTDAFIDEHRIDLVIHGNDFDREKVEFYYGPACRRAIFAYVPYEKGVSTTALLKEAGERGTFSCDMRSTLIDSNELIRRIKARLLITC